MKMYRNTSKQYHTEHTARTMKAAFSYWNKKTKQYQCVVKHYRKKLMMRLGFTNFRITFLPSH